MDSTAGSPPSAQLVGNAFVHQYYNILYQSPELVYRFYQEASKLGRPEAQGEMKSITTMQAINEKILSMDYAGFRAELKTVDAQESLNGGVLLLVTGYLTGRDNVRRSFTQSFFLATQDKGYFVLNDIFRYGEDADHQQGDQILADGSGVTPPLEQESPPPVEDQVPERSESPLAEKNDQVPERSESPLAEKEEVIEGEVHSPSDNEEGSTVDEGTPEPEVIDEVPDNSEAVVTDSGSTITPEEAPKKSYASIVKVKKEAVAHSAPASLPSRPAPANTERQVAPSPTPAPVLELPAASSNVTEINIVQESEAEGHSIYIKSLPPNATPTQVEEEFKRFGPIKPGGVQVRSQKLLFELQQQGFCFGFVEFEMASSVQNAIEASPVLIGGCQAFVEEKRPTGSRVSSRGRFPGRMGGFRNEGGRGRGSYGVGVGRGYSRGELTNRNEYGGRSGGRGGGSSGRGESSGYQRVDPARGARDGSVAASGSIKDVAPQGSAPV
ncbi:ras GTPase-activating protein-binding protein 1-like [Iris pallida]|uniref:Ras GTPase-activating protein-binding protein 1-like n=1 Tax=Iris pallida TaxID=29817 RepID=A0AAX6GQT1_IRIPA|nr:ras GTPase-activating protein-binding protein 1-like [Iris pallida]KAJ6830657.1 ras GTPase-activating protein-binding protein 1-like [Iris pallida]